jgi:hypothetical protein
MNEQWVVGKGSIQLGVSGLSLRGLEKCKQALFWLIFIGNLPRNKSRVIFAFTYIGHKIAYR